MVITLPTTNTSLVFRVLQGIRERREAKAEISRSTKNMNRKQIKIETGQVENMVKRYVFGERVPQLIFGPNKCFHLEEKLVMARVLCW